MTDSMLSWANANIERLKEKFGATTASTKHVSVAPPAAPPPAAAGRPLGPFDATDGLLGEGGYAKVILGINRETGQRVAIKLLDTKGDANTGRAASSEAAVVREVAALRRAGAHPNVCQLHGYYRPGEHVHAMVMELCTGGEMFRLVEKYGAIDEARVRPLFVGIVEGLRHLHAQGIAHRDLKLENILLSGKEKSVPKICDLGLAHVYARGSDGNGWADKPLTQFCGSRSYCAPEVMARLGYNGYAADVWSLGVCLFGLVSGFFPVDEASNRDWRYERVARHQHVYPEQSTTHLIYGFYQRQCPLSPALVDLLDRTLQVAPSKRASLADVIAAPWVHGHSLLPQAPPPPPPADLMDDVQFAPQRAPTAAATAPSTHQVEIDITDFLERSVSVVPTRSDEEVAMILTGAAAQQRAATADGNAYRSAADLGVGSMAPPGICRQRAEDSVGHAVAAA